MTGYNSKFFRHSCFDRGCYYLMLPCWDDLIECFPRNIRPTDVDGMIEINGHFLFLEEKRAGVGPDEGQRVALKKLSAMATVTVAFFRPGKSSEMEVLVLGDGDPLGWRPFDREQFRGWLRSWVHHAETGSAIEANAFTS